MVSLLLMGAALASGAQALLIAPATGPYAVSMSTQALQDNNRLDPYAPADSPHARRLMISTFMPVDETKTPCIGREVVPYLTPLVASAYEELGVALGLPNGTFTSFQMDFCKPKSRPCRPSSANAPLAIFSPGSGHPRLLYGAMAREVASHGFAVVTIDHPYDPSYVEFPDGTVYQARDLDTENSTVIEDLTQVRADDVSFVLTHLHENPIPGIDLDRTIMFGHSLGGATAGGAMLADRRILGGIDLDGSMWNPALDAGLDKPFLLVGREGHEDEDPSWDVFYNASRGQRAQIAVAGTTHASYMDFPVLIKSMNITLEGETKTVIEGELGTLEFGRSNEVVSGIVGAFAELVFDGKIPSLFKGNDSAYPEVIVVKAEL